jgi:hypothetical protein
MYAITWVTLLFWTVDIFVNFLTGVQKGKNIVLNPMVVAVEYLKFQFWLDLCIVGVDWVLVLSESIEGGSAARLGRSLRILKVLKTMKLLRTVKLKKYIQALHDKITSEAVSIWFGIANVVAILLFVSHLVACMWHALGEMDVPDEEPGWVMAKHSSLPIAHRYALSLHWSLSQFTPAPNDTFPQNLYERLFAIVVLVTALVGFSAFLSTVTAGVVQLSKISSAESRHFWQLRRYLRDWDVQAKFRKRVIRYLEYAFERQRRRVQPQDVVLLDLLSEQLRVELRQQTLKGYLSWHALFSKLNQQARIFSRALGAKSLATGDLAFGCAEEAEAMVFVGSGHLEYILGDLEDDVKSVTVDTEHLKECVLIGQWVCEAVLWTLRWIHLGDLQAQSETQIITIDSNEFGQSVRSHRLLWVGVRSYAQRFLEALNRISREDLTDMLQDLCSPQNMLRHDDFNQVWNTAASEVTHRSQWKGIFDMMGRLCGNRHAGPRQLPSPSSDYNPVRFV